MLGRCRQVELLLHLYYLNMHESGSSSGWLEQGEVLATLLALPESMLARAA